MINSLNALIRAIQSIVVFSVFLLIANASYAQWISIGPYYEPHLIGPNSNQGHGYPIFANSGEGIFLHSVYLSPSSGTYHYIYCTEDGGYNWDVCRTGVPFSLSFSRIKAANPNLFLLSSGTPVDVFVVEKKIVGSENWIPLFQDQGHLHDMQAPSSDVVFLWASHGLIRCIDTSCVYVFNVNYPSEASIAQIFFTDSLNGYKKHVTLDSELGSYMTYDVQTTTNGGYDWQLSLYDALGRIKCFHFPSTNVGYVGGRGGYAMKTIDHGMNWTTIETGHTRTISSVYFLNDTLGYMAADTGLIFKTVNGGESWVTEYIEQPITNIQFEFGYPDVLYAVAENGLFMTYPFYPLSTPPTTSIKDALFPNPTNQTLTLQSNLVSSTSQFTILDHVGRFMEKPSFQFRNKDVILDVGSIEQGIYYLKVSNGIKVLNFKFIKH